MENLSLLFEDLYKNFNDRQIDFLINSINREGGHCSYHTYTL